MTVQENFSIHFSFALHWLNAEMYIFFLFIILDPIIVDTMLVSTCGDWSPNGMYIAVGGTPTSKDADFDQVNIFSSMGKVSIS